MQQPQRSSPQPTRQITSGQMRAHARAERNAMAPAVPDRLRLATPSRFLTEDGRLQAVVLRQPHNAPAPLKPLPLALRELIDDGIIG